MRSVPILMASLVIAALLVPYNAEARKPRHAHARQYAVPHAPTKHAVRHASHPRVERRVVHRSAPVRVVRTAHPRTHRVPVYIGDLVYYLGFGTWDPYLIIGWDHRGRPIYLGAVMPARGHYRVHRVNRTYLVR